MTRYALTYAHVSSNVGDIALNAGLARALEPLGDITVVPVLARASAGLIDTAALTFPGLADSPHSLRHEDLGSTRLEYYCHYPEDFFEDLGLADCEGVILHSGEHLFRPTSLGQLHPLALWRLLPVLAAQATGRRTVILPSTFGPFKRREPLSRVIGQALKNADAVACRETYSRRIVRRSFRLKLPALLDPAFFLTHDEPPAGANAPLGVTMRLEGAGLRTGADDSRAYMDSLNESGFESSESFQFTRELLEQYLGHDDARTVDLYIQGRADEDLHAALHAWAQPAFGDRVRLRRPDGLDDYRAMLRGNSAVVAARFHACILAMAQGVPAWGVHMPSHGHKMLGLFDQLGASTQAVTIGAKTATQTAHAVAASLNEGGNPDVFAEIERLRYATQDWLGEALAPGRSTSDEDQGRLELRRLSEVSTLMREQQTPERSRASVASKDPRRQALAAGTLEPYVRISAGQMNRRNDNEIRDWIRSGWVDRGAEPISLIPPIDWTAASSNRQWEYHFHSWEFLGHALASPLLSQEREILSWAIELVRDWHRHYPEPAYDTEFPWYDMSIAWRTHQLAFLVGALSRADIADADFDLVFLVLDVHLGALADDRNFAAHSNHGFFVAAAQVSISRLLSAIPGMDVHADQARERLQAMIAQQFGRDGLHLEHSPDYHKMVINSLRQLVKNYPDELRPLREFTRRSEESLAWLITPDGWPATFGDSVPNVITPQTQVISPALKSIITQGKAGRPPTVNHQGFSHSGYWCVRDRWPTQDDSQHESYLAQTAAFHSRAHKHADDLSLVWWDRGREILIDPGRYGYPGRFPQGHPMWEQGFYYDHPARVYVESTKAHNTVEIDERSYQRRGVRPYGSALTAWGESDGTYWSVCDVTQLDTVQHRRVVVFSPGSWLLVTDHLNDPTTARLYRQHFHFAPEVTLSDKGHTLDVTHEEWSDALTVVTASGARRLPTYKGSEEPMMGWISREDRQLDPAWATGFEVPRGHEGRFATLLAFGGGAVEWESTPDEISVRWSVGDANFHVQCPQTGSEAQPTITRL